MKLQPGSLEQIKYDAEHPDEVTCDNCDGACCRAGLIIAVRVNEAAMVMQPVRAGDGSQLA